MKKILFNNRSMSNQEEKEYVVHATTIGVVIIPTFEQAEEKMVLSYDELNADISLIGLDEILEKIYQFVLEKTAKTEENFDDVVALIYSRDFEEVALRIATKNRNLNAQFDRE